MSLPPRTPSLTLTGAALGLGVLVDVHGHLVLLRTVDGGLLIQTIDDAIGRPHTMPDPKTDPQLYDLAARDMDLYVRGLAVAERMHYEVLRDGKVVVQTAGARTAIIVVEELQRVHPNATFVLQPVRDVIGQALSDDHKLRQVRRAGRIVEEDEG